MKRHTFAICFVVIVVVFFAKSWAAKAKAKVKEIVVDEVRLLGPRADVTRMVDLVYDLGVPVRIYRHEFQDISPPRTEYPVDVELAMTLTG